MNRFVRMKELAFLCTVLLIGGFVIGYLTMSEKKPDKLQKPDISEIGNAEELGDNQDLAVDKSGSDRVSPNTKLIFKSIYSECGHTVVERKDVPEEIVGFDEEELAGYYQLWHIERFTKDEVDLVRRIEGICPKHYLLGVQDGYIALYEFSEDGKPVLKEITDTPISILRLNDQQRLRKGILLDNMTEVNQLLEEFGS